MILLLELATNLLKINFYNHREGLTVCPFSMLSVSIVNSVLNVNLTRSKP